MRGEATGQLAVVVRPGTSAVTPGHVRALSAYMNVLDLIKATVACGVSAFLTYSYPTISQIVVIGLLSLLWLTYAHKTFSAIRRK